jgi:Mrp family chromosome partitioning ATPase
MLDLLEELENHFERVIIDSPALMVVSDMRALVGRVSGVLIVSAVNYTRRSAAEEFRQQIELLGGHSLGIVANLVSTSRYGSDEYYSDA